MRIEGAFRTGSPIRGIFDPVQDRLLFSGTTDPAAVEFAILAGAPRTADSSFGVPLGAAAEDSSEPADVVVVANGLPHVTAPAADVAGGSHAAAVAAAAPEVVLDAETTVVAADRRTVGTVVIRDRAVDGDRGGVLVAAAVAAVLEEALERGDERRPVVAAESTGADREGNTAPVDMGGASDPLAVDVRA